MHTTVGILFVTISLLSIFVGEIAYRLLGRYGEFGRKLWNRNRLKNLFGYAIWLTMLAGGWGILREQPWGWRTAELSLWMLLLYIVVHGGLRIWTLYLLVRPENGELRGEVETGVKDLVADTEFDESNFEGVTELDEFTLRLRQEIPRRLLAVLFWVVVLLGMIYWMR